VARVFPRITKATPVFISAIPDDEVDCTEVVKQEIKVMAWVPVTDKEVPE